MRSESTGQNNRKGADGGGVTLAGRRIQQGDAVGDHFELLFRHYEPKIRGHLRRDGWRDADLDDVVQEVMLRVYKGLKTFRLEASFDTWILRIMSNASKNAIRGRHTGKARATRTSLDALLAVRDESGPRLAEPASAQEGPLDSFLAGERKARLAAALDRLPKRIRQCLLFRYQGFKYREIAEAQGVSVATVKKQISQGHKRLRPILGPYVELFGILLVLTLLLA
jgi:RNA polymerase sigma-70 factor (ECF subfamily)